jgi:hypothetical protein
MVFTEFIEAIGRIADKLSIPNYLEEEVKSSINTISSD